MRPADIASIMVLCGLAAQCAGLCVMFGGVSWSLVVVGTELAALGLVGVWSTVGWVLLWFHGARKPRCDVYPVLLDRQICVGDQHR